MFSRICVCLNRTKPHCVKRFQIHSYFWAVLSPNIGKYEREVTPYLDTFHAVPWLELKIKFNQYSERSFQKALVGFNNLWIYLVFKEYNWVSMSKIPHPPFQLESWTRCLGGLIFCIFRKNCICFFQFPFSFILE